MFNAAYSLSLTFQFNVLNCLAVLKEVTRLPHQQNSVNMLQRRGMKPKAERYNCCSFRIDRTAGLVSLRKKLMVLTSSVLKITSANNFFRLPIYFFASAYEPRIL